jgi:hypothetical protein
MLWVPLRIGVTYGNRDWRHATVSKHRPIDRKQYPMEQWQAACERTQLLIGPWSPLSRTAFAKTFSSTMSPPPWSSFRLTAARGRLYATFRRSVVLAATAWNSSADCFCLAAGRVRH